MDDMTTQAMLERLDYVSNTYNYEQAIKKVVSSALLARHTFTV